MFSSYQNSQKLSEKPTKYDGSITDLDTKHNTKHNLLSYFNFMSSSNKYKKIKYYLVGAIVSVILILIVLNGTSNGSNTAVSTPLLSPTNDNIDATLTDFCEDPDYFKKTLKEVYTQVIGGIIKNAENCKKYEASGVIYDSSRDVYWVVFDSLYALGKLTSDLTRNENNLLVLSNVNGVNENEKGLESGYEGIARDADTDTFYLLTEAVKFKDNNDDTIYHPVLRSAKYDGQETYNETQMCAVDFLTATDNKGFESVNLIQIDGEKYFVGLCEGNYCDGGKKGKERGNGRMILFNFVPKTLNAETDSEYQYLIDDDINCLYTVIGKYKLPEYIHFIDYSAFHFHAMPNHGKSEGLFDLAVVSQESASVWVGEVAWNSVEKGPDFDVNEKDGKIYKFPQNDDCETIYCNVEGVTFINNDQFVMVSDQAKKDGKQGYICGEKDQSIHIFQKP